MEPLSRGEIIAILSLFVTCIGAVASWLVVPQVQRIFERNRQAHQERNNRMFLLYSVILVGLFILAALFLANSTWGFVERKLIVNDNTNPGPSPLQSPSSSGTPASSTTPNPSPTPTTETADRNLKDVLEKKHEKNKIGGGVVLSDIGILVEKDFEKKKEIIGVIFKQITDKSALVNLALDGKVEIKEVRLASKKMEDVQEGGPKYYVSIRVKNMTGEELTVNVPKGQIFENEKAGTRKQNLAAANHERENIPANGEDTLYVEAYCVNERYAPPDGGQGYVTIFEIESNSFFTQQQLWDYLEARQRRR